MLVHSATHFADWAADVSIFAVFEATLGEVATRLRVRGWSGDRGVDSDLRIDRAADRGVSPLGAGRLDGVAGGWGFEASVNDLIVTLMTCVASAFRSFVLSVSGALDAAMVVLVFVFAGCLVSLVADFEFEVDGSEASGRSIFFSVMTVAAVHVEGEATAVLTVSTCACTEAIGYCKSS